MNGYGYEKHLYFRRAIDKYGWDGFRHIILLENLTERQANEMEAFYIKFLNSNDRNYGYNMTAGGDGISGFRHTIESRKLMSKAKSGENHPNYRKHRSPETRQRISEKLLGNKNCLGVVRSESTIEKMAAAKRKPVTMYDDNGSISTFSSAKNAEEITGISRKNISLCCTGKRKKAGGYMWKFA